jgi:mannose-1-phosphate guanylyltransferase
MRNHFYAVIMAGGGGTRLWPLSRKKHPKQMLQLVDDLSLFQTAVQRLNGLFQPENIFVVTIEDQAEALHEQCPEIPYENFLIEPMPRGTASVVGFAAIALQKIDSKAVMAVLTADHVIANESKFHQLLTSAYGASQEGYLVTLGIAPTHPATGYGYIQQGELIDSINGFDVYNVSRFVEKPTEEKAQEMLNAGSHSWNSGMFIWRLDCVLAEISKQIPDLTSKLAEISRAWDQPEKQEVILATWPTIIPQTIDYGIMENAEKVAVIPALDLGWNDVGSWDALFDILPQDSEGNVTKGGKHIPLETHNSLLFTNQKNRLIVTIGVDDLLIVDTGDVLLVCKKEEAQSVRQVVDQLKAESKREYI